MDVANKSPICNLPKKQPGADASLFLCHSKGAVHFSQL